MDAAAEKEQFNGALVLLGFGDSSQFCEGENQISGGKMCCSTTTRTFLAALRQSHNKRLESGGDIISSNAEKKNRTTRTSWRLLYAQLTCIPPSSPPPSSATSFLECLRCGGIRQHGSCGACTHLRRINDEENRCPLRRLRRTPILIRLTALHALQFSSFSQFQAIFGAM